MDLDSSVLRAFVAVADELHFGRAAQGMFISQQALSQRIARLESALGVALLDRGRRRGVTLTPAGHTLLPSARDAVDAIDAIASVARTGTESLTVDVLDEHLTMMSWVRAVKKADPSRELSVVMRNDAADAVTRLRDGSADIALGRPGDVVAPWPADVQGRPVLAEPIRLLVANGHELAAGAAVRLEDLSHRRLWFPTAGAPAEWTDLLDELVATFDLTVDGSGSTFGYAYWLERVADGSAPPSLIGAGMQLPPGLPVSSLPIIDPTPVFWWWAMWRRRIPGALVDGFFTALGSAAATTDIEIRGEVWLPQTDALFRRPGGRSLRDRPEEPGRAASRHST